MRRLALLALLALPLTARGDPGFMEWPTLQGAKKSKPAPGSLFTEDANTTCHYYWTGTAIQEKTGHAGCTPTMNGTVPQVAASGRVPPGAGPFSTANRYSVGTGNDVFDYAADFYVCFVAKPDSADLSGSRVPFSDGTNSGSPQGYYFQFSNTGAFRLVTESGTQTDITNISATTMAAGSVHAMCGGRAGTTGRLMVDRGASGTGTTATPTVGTAQVASIGSFPMALPEDGTLIEVIFESSTPTDAAYNAQIGHALSAMGL